MWIHNPQAWLLIRYIRSSSRITRFYAHKKTRRFIYWRKNAPCFSTILIVYFYIMIVQLDSPITRIPKEFPPRDILILEGLRYSANMAFLSYERLYQNLIEVSTKDVPIDILYASLNDAWAVIDSANRLYNLIKELKINGEPPIKKEWENFKKIRNTFQHIGERIDEKYVDDHYPLFGLLKWVYYDPDNDPTRAKGFIFFPGIQQGEKNYQGPNPFGKKLQIPIDMISITAHQRAKNTLPVKVELALVIHAIESTVKQVEENLKQIYTQLNNPHEIFPTDGILALEFKFQPGNS